MVHLWISSFGARVLPERLRVKGIGDGSMTYDRFDWDLPNLSPSLEPKQERDHFFEQGNKSVNTPFLSMKKFQKESKDIDNVGLFIHV